MQLDGLVDPMAVIHPTLKLNAEEILQFPFSRLPGFAELSDQTLALTPQAFLGFLPSTPVPPVETTVLFTAIRQQPTASSAIAIETIAMSPEIQTLIISESNTTSTQIISQQPTPTTETSPQIDQDPANSQVSEVPVLLWGLVPILILLGLFSAWRLRDRSSKSQPQSENDRSLAVTPEPEDKTSITSDSTTVPTTPALVTQVGSIEEEISTQPTSEILTPNSPDETLSDESSSLEPTVVSENEIEQPIDHNTRREETVQLTDSEALFINETENITQEISEDYSNEESIISDVETREEIVQVTDSTEVIDEVISEDYSLESTRVSEAVTQEETENEPIISEDYSLESTRVSEAETQEETENAPIISEDYSLESTRVLEAETQEETENEPIISEDYSLESTRVSEAATQEETENEPIISEDYSLESTRVSEAETEEETVNVNEEISEDYWLEETSLSDQEEDESIAHRNGRDEKSQLISSQQRELDAIDSGATESVIDEDEQRQLTPKVQQTILSDSKTEEVTAETQEPEIEIELRTSEQLKDTSAIAETVNLSEEIKVQSQEEEASDQDLIINLSDDEEIPTQGSTEVQDVALTEALVASIIEDVLDRTSRSQEAGEIQTATDTVIDQPVEPEKINPENDNISATTSDTLDSTADRSTLIGGATAGMGFPGINESSDSALDDEQQINLTTKDTISLKADIPQQQTETSQPEIETVGDLSEQPKHLEVASSVAETSDSVEVASEEESSRFDHESWIVLELHDPENVHAYWNVVSEDRQQLRQKGGQQFALRLYDVTFIDMDVQKPHSLREYECEESAKELYIPVPMKERDYIVEIGYVTEEGRWLKLIRSTYIHFPWDFPWPEEPPEPTDQTEVSDEDEPSETTDEQQPETNAEQTETIADVEPPQIQSDLEAISTEEATLIEPPSISVETPVSEDKITLSETVQVAAQQNQTFPTVKPSESVNKIEKSAVETPQLEQTSKALTSVEETSQAANQMIEEPFSEERTQSNIAATKFNLGQSETSEQLAAIDQGLPSLPGGYGETKIVLLPIDPNWIYVYWDIPNEDREKLRQQGGKQLAFRVCDVTEIDLNTQNPHSVEFYQCDELAREWHIPVPMSDRDYLVEIGYVTADERWLLLARSLHVRVPPIYPSDREDYQQRTVTWEENLRKKFFFNLRSAASLLSFMTTIEIFHNPFSNQIPS
ncbi:DUF4912 domain-containing protein [Limnoraphis robusta Tam1]|uniref:DUF4912 domain-containing protein n=1 Tax=Limnoraphis robusta TaxID=1118279 RepID=UPI002B217183|nr:DUF4912 domain-containing protein [Limnoraphis robusta]MEA5540649.1 DUF4912 domain-containing protein [Limnoraphis robusta Tam1]